LLTTTDIDNFWGAGPMPRYGGDDMAAVMRDFAAVIPWRSVSHNLTLLDSHDTARFRSLAERGHQHLGVAVMMTMPDLPMIFAGNKVGVQGVHMEDDRRPFPWQESTCDVDTRNFYRA
jgi:alpha-glucosidase